MKQQIFSTRNDWTGLILRLTLGLILFPHGAQKVFGWFGGPGFTNEMAFFTDTLHLPWLIAFLVIAIEFVGALSLIIGFASRIWSIAMICLFTGIIFTAHAEHGFFMNWFGTQKGEGYEYHLLVIGLSLALLVNGSGRYAIDNSLIKPAKMPLPALVLPVTLLLLFTACNHSAPAAEQKNKQLVERYFNEVWNSGHVEVLDELLSRDYINHTPSVPDPQKGPDGLKPIVNAIRKAFPDLHYTIKDIIATNNRVVARVVMTGSNSCLIC
ncbi:ester cyclase [Chitinophaga sp. 22321]|uniref:Ester cyclase n=1 Tax=Chitinophaga hostae TaxID=2831022 RepID=A0ABS5J5G4_9BACT|nr:ester cyclase [Chitinophaga hostae]MBS0030405.1 ester cyclase [Chitinophaga hostae]